jgi:hypothetical protein
MVIALTVADIDKIATNMIALYVKGDLTAAEEQITDYARHPRLAALLVATLAGMGQTLDYVELLDDDIVQPEPGYERRDEISHYVRALLCDDEGTCNRIIAEWSKEKLPGSEQYKMLCIIMRSVVATIVHLLKTPGAKR